MPYIMVETIFGAWLFTAPRLGAGPLGLKLGAMFPVIALVHHRAYGTALASVYPLARSEEDKLPAISTESQPA